MIEPLIAFFLGSILNVWWRRKGNKYEYGLLKIHEHYHFLLESLILYVLTKQEWLWGFGLALLIDECYYQRNPFAYGSNHWKESTYIGFFLFVILILVSLYVSP